MACETQFNNPPNIVRVSKQRVELNLLIRRALFERSRASGTQFTNPPNTVRRRVELNLLDRLIPPNTGSSVAGQVELNLLFRRTLFEWGKRWGNSI